MGGATAAKCGAVIVTSRFAGEAAAADLSQALDLQQAMRSVFKGPEGGESCTGRLYGDQWLLPSREDGTRDNRWEDSVTLYRPVGQKEYELIRDSKFASFPPRLPHQPIFYPVLTEQYAIQIARDWNTKDAASGYVGHVARFQISQDFWRAIRSGKSGVQKRWSIGSLPRNSMSSIVKSSA